MRILLLEAYIYVAGTELIIFLKAEVFIWSDPGSNFSPGCHTLCENLTKKFNFPPYVEMFPQGKLVLVNIRSRKTDKVKIPQNITEKLSKISIKCSGKSRNQIIWTNRN